MNYGRYQIVEEIGKGSMGVVYKAHDPNLDLMVALKVLRQDRVESEDFVRRFTSEARVLGRLDHRNIVRVYNVDEDQGTVYIAMEFIEGESLGDMMQRKRFTPQEIIEWGILIADTLGYAHQKGVVHRDVKPSNILFKSDGSLKITDFGIAHIQDTTAAEKTQAGEILGTPAYMSPEQVKSQQIDGRSDLFSLGIILYELCTGTRPFKGDNISALFQAIIQEDPLEITHINPDIPSKLAKIVMKCLRKKADERFETGEALSEALQSCPREKDSSKQGSNKTIENRKINIISIIGIILLGSVIGGGIYYFYEQSKVKSPPLNEPAIAASAILNVESTPSEAQVLIDGDFKSKTPAKLKLLVGKHLVLVKLPQYHEWMAQVQLTQEVETPLFIHLSPAKENDARP
jgi:serine/threonine protein kinase